MFEGCKFRPTGETRMVTNKYGERVEREVFTATKAYSDYCKEKREEEQRRECEILKNKLQFQRATYGEVDEVDFQEYKSLIKSIYGIEIS